MGVGVAVGILLLYHRDAEICLGGGKLPPWFFCVSKAGRSVYMRVKVALFDSFRDLFNYNSNESDRTTFQHDGWWHSLDDHMVLSPFIQPTRCSALASQYWRIQIEFTSFLCRSQAKHC